MKGIVSVVSISVMVLLFAVSPAKAGVSYTPVDFSSQANATLTALMPGAPTGNVTLGGIPFDIASNSDGYQAWRSNEAANGGSGEFSLTMNVNLYGASEVYTLINTDFGHAGPDSYAWLIFTGADGATYTKYLVGGVDIRDYNGYSWENDINGTTTVNVWNCSQDVEGLPGRMDMQIISLPAEFADTTLTTIELVDNGAPRFQRTILDGVTVEGIGSPAAVPEPISMIFFGTGLVAVSGFVARRKMARKA